MKPRLALMLAALVALGLPAGSPPGARADSRDVLGDTSAVGVLEQATDPSSAVRFGFGAAPLHGPLAPIPVDVPGMQEGETTTVVSFDLNLRWPSASRGGVLEPYLTLGPALFVVEPDFAGRLLGTRPDPTVQLGARLGAGVNWRVGKHATIFGGYEMTTTAPGGLGSFATRGAAESGVSGYDFTYGLRFLY
jgi:hypothetical protein